MLLIHCSVAVCMLAGLARSQSSGPSENFLVSNSVLDLAFKISNGADSNGNSVFSPLSISTALNLLLLGSEGATKNDLKKFLGYPETLDSQIHDSFADMIKTVNSKASGVEIKIANGLATQPGVGLSKKFIQDASTYYLANTGTLDFKSKPEVAMNTINEWVSNRTHGKIPSLLSQPLPSRTEMILLNALYFKGAWETPFPIEQTRKLDFFLEPGRPVKADFMANIFSVPYADSKELDCKAIVLPYVDRKYGMLFLLPNADGPDALKILESKITRAALDKLMLEDMKPRFAVVQIPKFKIRQTMNLRSLLLKAGATSVFGSSVNFSGIANGITQVDDILHQAYIKVSEEGTEAAAATGITLSRDAPAKSFIASKPFAFILRHNTLDLSIFHGHVVRP